MSQDIIRGFIGQDNNLFSLRNVIFSIRKEKNLTYNSWYTFRIHKMT